MSTLVVAATHAEVRWQGRIVAISEGPLVEGERQVEVTAVSLHQGSLQFYLPVGRHPRMGDPVEAAILITYQEHTP